MKGQGQEGQTPHTKEAEGTVQPRIRKREGAVGEERPGGGGRRDTR